MGFSFSLRIDLCTRSNKLRKTLTFLSSSLIINVLLDGTIQHDSRDPRDIIIFSISSGVPPALFLTYCGQSSLIMYSATRLLTPTASPSSSNTLERNQYRFIFCSTCFAVVHSFPFASPYRISCLKWLTEPISSHAQIPSNFH